MVVAALAVGGVLLLAMIGASGWGAVRLAPGARVPIHLGSAERAYWAPKGVGLAVWPLVGALCYGVIGGISASQIAANWVPGVRDVLAPAVMVVLLGFQVGALILARRGNRGGAEADMVGGAEGDMVGGAEGDMVGGAEADTVGEARGLKGPAGASEGKPAGG